MSISYSTPSQRCSILDRVVGAFGGMRSGRPRALAVRPEPSPVRTQDVAAPSMMIVRDSMGNGVTGEIKDTEITQTEGKLTVRPRESGGPAPSAGMRLEVPILERAGKPAQNSARPRCLRVNFIAGGIASMAHYSTFRPASASRKALSHAETFGGDPIAPSASWVANGCVDQCPNMIDARPSLGPSKALGLPSAHCTLQVGESGRGKDRPLSASINHDNNSYWDLGQTKRIAVSTEHPEKNNARSAGSASLVSPLPHGPPQGPDVRGARARRGAGCRTCEWDGTMGPF
ncbi:uncharacterized protein BO96DRAFT_431614 [Aspergillus niger CBS 101883]|uniref:Uncharacterized protein n=2 Tax=Aspergillus niger TaxID=5061 RepID=A2QIM3_ASPNC|nr:uncharacterized protein BO96DRAFT_431614 [Aspergillus niger CBS 101883]XP_059600517.1 hypothetical protein An04g04030 [Aspergillus niger]PYH59465.1 hypothetical protein BO96DRAFT_431614 [Aspergillus niger CBS 101883]CAK38667.1 hypothetical protein An04g04030 [Aspergillus niger]